MKYKYKVDTKDFFSGLGWEGDEDGEKKYLNDMGNKGWELVSVTKRPGTSDSWHRYYWKLALALAVLAVVAVVGAAVLA